MPYSHLTNVQLLSTTNKVAKQSSYFSKPSGSYISITDLIQQTFSCYLKYSHMGANYTVLQAVWPDMVKSSYLAMNN